MSAAIRGDNQGSRKCVYSDPWAPLLLLIGGTVQPAKGVSMDNKGGVRVFLNMGLDKYYTFLGITPALNQSII